MESDIKDYQVVDYNIWDFSGKGENISHLLLPTEQRIWEGALPFQDKRDDLGHAEFMTYFSLRLLDYIQAKREIVIPAAILHDTGWSQMSKTELKLFYDLNWERYEPILRARHQEEGVNLARRLLTDLRQTKNIGQVLEIISQHDTRKGFLSPEEGVVRDADKLWRFTLPCCELEIRKKRNFGRSLYDQRLKWLSERNFFYSDISKDIAGRELENSLKNLKMKNMLKKFQK